MRHIILNFKIRGFQECQQNTMPYNFSTTKYLVTLIQDIIAKGFENSDTMFATLISMHGGLGLFHIWGVYFFRGPDVGTCTQ